jgi:hypothetical protein
MGPGANWGHLVGATIIGLILIRLLWILRILTRI